MAGSITGGMGVVVLPAIGAGVFAGYKASEALIKNSSPDGRQTASTLGWGATLWGGVGAGLIMGSMASGNFSNGKLGASLGFLALTGVGLGVGLASTRDAASGAAQAK